MTISRVIGGLGLLVGTTLAAQGCSSAGLRGGDVTEENAGSVVLALMNSPVDATCLRLTAQGATTAIRSFDLAPGQSTSLKASGLPLGSVAFTAEGFASACSAVTDMSVATWNSDKVSATLAAGVPATISIALHRPGSANISVSFPEVGTCNGTPGQWDGCRGTGCWVCSEQLAGFPKYMQNHPGCVTNDTCGGQFFTCNAACPAPTDADRDVAACDGTPGQWSGCRGTGCSVCSEKLSAYPLYFQNHPSCLKNDTCGGQFFTCNAACPAPTDADRDVAACDGTPGQWSGCRGTGCSVCSEKLSAYPKYFQNHPSCLKNDTCGGQFFTCNAACPAPTDADRDVAACDGTPGQWSGCRGTGCSVCSEKLSAYPLYFQNHPSCLKNDTCAGQFFTCNAACPAPTPADQAPATRLYFEAESGGVAAPLSSLTDAAASGGKYVMVAAGNNASSTAPSNGHLTYTFALTAAGTVKVFGRFVVGAGGANDDSVWARVDGGTWLNWNNISSRIGTSKPWAWDSAHDSSAGDVEKTWPLSAGNHTLEVAYREDGLEMDRFFVTSDATALP